MGTKSEIFRSFFFSFFGSLLAKGDAGSDAPDRRQPCLGELQRQGQARQCDVPTLLTERVFGPPAAAPAPRAGYAQSARHYEPERPRKQKKSFLKVRHSASTVVGGALTRAGGSGSARCACRIARARRPTCRRRSPPLRRPNALPPLRRPNALSIAPIDVRHKRIHDDAPMRGG